MRELSEYLTLFSDQGDVRVKVKFKKFSGKVADRTMAASEVTRIVTANGDSFLTEMAFDDWPFEIIKYEIDPVRKILTIHARQTQIQEGKPPVTSDG